MNDTTTTTKPAFNLHCVECGSDPRPDYVRVECDNCGEVNYHPYGADWTVCECGTDGYFISPARPEEVASHLTGMAVPSGQQVRRIADRVILDMDEAFTRRDCLPDPDGDMEDRREVLDLIRPEVSYSGYGEEESERLTNAVYETVADHYGECARRNDRTGRTEAVMTCDLTEDQPAKIQRVYGAGERAAAREVLRDADDAMRGDVRFAGRPAGVACALDALRAAALCQHGKRLIITGPLWEHELLQAAGLRPVGEA